MANALSTSLKSTSNALWVIVALFIVTLSITAINYYKTNILLNRVAILEQDKLLNQKYASPEKMGGDSKRQTSELANEPKNTITRNLEEDILNSNGRTAPEQAALDRKNLNAANAYKKSIGELYPPE